MENGQPQCSYEGGVRARSLIDVGHKNIWSDGPGWTCSTDGVGFKMTNELSLPNVGSTRSRKFGFVGINNGISVAAGRVSTYRGTFCIT